jgi:hypothetical protein
MIADLDLFINMRIEEQRECHSQLYIVGGNENQMKLAFGIIVEQSFACYNSSRNSSHELLT